MLYLLIAKLTVQQIESHLITRNYEGFASGGARVRGRVGYVSVTPGRAEHAHCASAAQLRPCASLRQRNYSKDDLG